MGFLGAGIFTIAWNLALRPGERTPRWLPVPVAIGIFAGSLVLYFALDARQNGEIAQSVKASAEGAQSQIEIRLEARVRSLLRMAKRWEFSGAPSRAVWENDAANYVHDFPDLQALEWIDASHVARWIVPLAGNEDKLNRDLTEEARRKAALTEAERRHQPEITRVVTLFHGGLGFVLYVPIIVRGQPDGFIEAVFNVPPAREDWVARERIELRGAAWDLEMWPTPALAARLNSPLPKVVLFAGLLAALLLGAVCFYAQRSSRQALETARVNAALREALDTVKTLQGLLPICTCCKRVRDDTGYWNQIDTYLGLHTNASLSHGYCPECAANAFLEYGLEIPDEVQAQVAARNFE
jgi:hypothetical protein